MRTVEEMFRVDGKTALVTGGAGGIGLACAKALAAAGADLILSDIDGGRLDEAARLLESRDELIHRLEQEIELEKSAIINALNERAGLTARSQRYETMMEQVDLRRSEVTQKLLKFKSDESVQEEQIRQEEDALSAVERRIAESQEKSAQTEEELNQADQELRRLNRNLNDTQQQYHMSYTKLESLRNLAERYDGYGGSIRRVMEVRDRIRGIHGVVADLIHVPQKYEVAIETALGGSIQNIVTDSEETAKRLMTYYSYKEIARRSHTAVECHLSQCSRRCVWHPRSKKVAQITICHLSPRLD